MVERLFRLLFYCENGINQYGEQKSLTDVFRGSLLLTELSCFITIVEPRFKNASCFNEKITFC